MLVAVALALMLAPAGAVKPAQVVTIYVGPHVRDGFVDVDRGVLDSIKDIRKELLKDRSLRVVATPESAALRLFVVRRGYGDAAGGVGVPVGGLTIMVPMRTRFVESVLRVGEYERVFVGEDVDSENWKKCAKGITRDVSLWLDANRERIAGKE